MNKCSKEFSIVSGINVSYAEADDEYMQLKSWEILEGLVNVPQTGYLHSAIEIKISSYVCAKESQVCNGILNNA